MSVRIEEADALEFLAELPAGSAQMCLTSPPAAPQLSEVLAALSEARRALRDDGTLWLVTHPDAGLETGVRRLGFAPLALPWAPQRSAQRRRTQLRAFAKQPRGFCEPLAGTAWVAGRRAHPADRRARRACAELDRDQRRELIRVSILAGSAPLACRRCGAPFRMAPDADGARLRHPTCAHDAPGARCVVLDPFARPGDPTAELAHRLGRSFIGVCAPPESGRS